MNSQAVRLGGYAWEKAGLILYKTLCDRLKPLATFEDAVRLTVAVASISRLSAEGQVTIPKEVRRRLGLAPGDMVAYEIDDSPVTIGRIEPFDAVFHKAISETLEEWHSPQDDEAFRDL